MSENIDIEWSKNTIVNQYRTNMVTEIDIEQIYRWERGFLGQEGHWIQIRWMMCKV
jgi:hypothetical protein